MRRASSDEPHACLVYHFVVIWVVWNNLCFLVWLFAIAVMSSLWRYLFVGIALMTWPKSWPVGTDHCSIWYCFQGNVSTYAFELRHYLDTNPRAEICVTAINMGLKTSNDLYTCLSRKTCQMRTLELHYCKERGTCIGCLCMLIPKYAVSSRDECVVLAVMTVKESSTQLYWVGVCVQAIMCVALAARMVLMHISVKILSAVRSRPLTQVSFHVHYFASYFDIVYLEIHHIAWKIARSIVWVKRFDCENCNIKTNVNSH